jgi:N-methylhydantoinase B/oxoprolinase/acetone carboxylase alpha subunit
VSEWNEDIRAQIGARANGNEKLRQLFKEKPEWYELLEEDINKMLISP